VQGLIQNRAGRTLAAAAARPAAGLASQSLDKLARGAFVPPVDLRTGPWPATVAQVLAELSRRSERAESTSEL